MCFVAQAKIAGAPIFERWSANGHSLTFNSRRLALDSHFSSIRECISALSNTYRVWCTFFFSSYSTQYMCHSEFYYYTLGTLHNDGKEWWSSISLITRDCVQSNIALMSLLLSHCCCISRKSSQFVLAWLEACGSGAGASLPRENRRKVGFPGTLPPRSGAGTNKVFFNSWIFNGWNSSTGSRSKIFSLHITSLTSSFLQLLNI